MNEETSTEETSTEPTSFEVPVYASVWKSGLESYLDGSRDSIKDYQVDLLIGTVPTDYSEHNAYMPVGVVTVKIPNKVQRIQTELLAIDVAIEAEKERSLGRLEDMAERKQQLMALPHLPEVEEELLSAAELEAHLQAALDEEERTSD